MVAKKVEIVLFLAPGLAQDSLQTLAFVTLIAGSQAL